MDRSRSSILHLRRRAAAIVLAGGYARRFGRDKAFASVDGTTLLDRIVASLHPHLSPVVVVGRVAQRLPPLSVPAVVLTDPPGWSGTGPVAGLLSALAYLEAAGVDRAFVTACDMPHVTGPLGLQLAEALGRHGTMILVADETGRPQPFVSAMRVGPALAASRRLVAEGYRAMRDLTAVLGAHVLPATWTGSPNCVRGVNTLEAFVDMFGAPP